VTVPAEPPVASDGGGPIVLVHQPIRMANAAWGGAPQKMENGSEPQPWHCMPFVEGATYGLELLTPRAGEGRVSNVDGELRCQGMGLAPGPLPGFYQLRARLGLQPPPGHAVRLLPHPRHFTDDTGTVPLPLAGHMPAALCTSEAAILFRGPGPGQEHIFRPGEPMAQIVFVPEPMRYNLMPMSTEDETRRRVLYGQIETSKLDIADHIWRNAAGIPFNNHYKLMARAFARAGVAGVEEVVHDAVRINETALAGAKTVADFMAIGIQRINEQKLEQARDIFTRVLDHDPKNAQAYGALGYCLGALGFAKEALARMTEAVALQPGAVNLQMNLGDFLRSQRRLSEAEAIFQRALALAPTDAKLRCFLAMTLQEQGRTDEALTHYRAAVAAGRAPVQAHFGLGTLLAAQGQRTEARACLEAALALDPTYKPARQALEALKT
jgi:Tfp pilus assembly protein PilF